MRRNFAPHRFVFCLGHGQVIEAAGGDSTTRTKEDARLAGAHVRIRPTDYRGDIVAKVSLSKKQTVLPFIKN